MQGPKTTIEKYYQDDVNELEAESKSYDKEGNNGLIENDNKCDTSYINHDYATYDIIGSIVTDTINNVSDNKLYIRYNIQEEYNTAEI